MSNTEHQLEPLTRVESPLEQEGRAAYNNYYFKCRASLPFEEWFAIWKYGYNAAEGNT